MRTLRTARSLPPLGALLACALTLASACTVGPNYVRPTAPVPASYQETDGWQGARPRDAISRGEWWQVFGNPELDALEIRVRVSNQDVAAADARFRQARALVEAARATFFPVIGVGAQASRARASSSVPESSGARVEGDV